MSPFTSQLVLFQEFKIISFIKGRQLIFKIFSKASLQHLVIALLNTSHELHFIHNISPRGKMQLNEGWICCAVVRVTAA